MLASVIVVISHILILCCPTLVTSTSVPTTVYYDLVLTRILITPDGYERSGIVVNGGLVGPSIEAYVGDTVIVNVTNMASDQEGFTIHWHGVVGLKSAWYDGAETITSCPIPRGSSFVQEFTALSEGTHFYHAHTGSLRAEGVVGAIVFRSRSPSVQYDAELTLILTDWYHTNVVELSAGLHNNPFKFPGVGNSILFNGKGLSRECSNYTASTTTATRVTYSDGTVADTTATCLGKRERLLVAPGKTYLLRLVNAASLGYFNFAIAGHNLTIVGAGTSATAQSSVSSVELSSGQRLEVLLTCDKHVLDVGAPSSTFSFLMSAKTDYRGPDTSYAGIGYAFLTYALADTPPSQLSFQEVSPLSPTHVYHPWDTWSSFLRQNTSHASYRAPPLSTQKSFTFVTKQEWVNSKTGRGFEPATKTPTPGDHTMSQAWTMNRQRLVMPSTPFLLTSYLDQAAAQDPSIFRITRGDVVDITVENAVAGNGVCECHPWHLHGAAGWLVGEGPGAFDPATDPANYNLVDAPYLDTVSNFPSAHGNRRVGTFESGAWETACGWFTLRVVITEPGMWFFHCHVDWHSSMGMGVVFDVESEAVERYPADMALCGEAIARDVYRSDTAASNSNEGESFSESQILGVAFGCFFGALACVALAFVGRFYFAKYSPGSGLLSVKGAPVVRDDDNHNL